VSDAAQGKRSFRNFLPSFSSGGDNASPFAKALREGLLAGAILFFLMIVWMVLRAEDTAKSLQPLIPFKVATIEEPEIPVTPQDPNAPAVGLQNAKNIHALPPAPIDGLSESKDGRILPVTRIQDDMTPFQAYKKPFTAEKDKNLVSIVVLDFGMSDKISTSLLDNLPPEISLVISPYTSNASKWASAARAYGHEFWLSLPMQTKEDDTGPNTLLSGAPLEQNKARLMNVLSSAVGYAGLVTQKNHVLKPDDGGASDVLTQIFGRGLALAESNPSETAYGLSVAMESGYPYAQNNFWIDADLRPEYIDRALRELEMQAANKGKAIAFVHPYPVAMKKIQQWMLGMEDRGLQLAPLSAMTE